MDTALLIDQLSVAVLASVVALALIQKIKPAFPARWVSVFSAIISLTVGFLFAFYYRKYDLTACIIVGVYTFIGADGLYSTFTDKLKSYTQMKAVKLNDEVQSEPDQVG